MEGDAVDDFADRLKHEFEDNVSDTSDMNESQDWFVNDKREDERPPSPTSDANKEVSAASPVPLAPSTIPSPASKASISHPTSNPAEEVCRDVDIPIAKEDDADSVVLTALPSPERGRRR